MTTIFVNFEERDTDGLICVFFIRAESSADVQEDLLLLMNTDICLPAVWEKTRKKAKGGKKSFLKCIFDYLFSCLCLCIYQWAHALHISKQKTGIHIFCLLCTHLYAMLPNVTVVDGVKQNKSVNTILWTDGSLFKFLFELSLQNNMWDIDRWSVMLLFVSISPFFGDLYLFFQYKWLNYTLYTSVV